MRVFSTVIGPAGVCLGLAVSSPALTAPAPSPIPPPRVADGRMYAAPGAPPFARGTAPGVWVRDVPPSPRAASARAFGPAGAAGAPRGFYSPRMTYLMPDGRCVSGPPRAATSSPASARRWCPVRADGKSGRAAMKGGRG